MLMFVLLVLSWMKHTRGLSLLLLVFCLLCSRRPVMSCALLCCVLYHTHCNSVLFSCFLAYLPTNSRPLCLYVSLLCVTTQQWVDYFTAPDRASRQLFNVLSLSLGGTPLEAQVMDNKPGGL